MQADTLFEIFIEKIVYLIWRIVELIQYQTLTLLVG